MAGSAWNAYLERLLAAELTVAEYRLAIALVRLLLGWKQTGAYLGRALIRQTAGGMDGRSFDRALAGLTGKGIVRYQPGGVGKGNRSHYELVLDPDEMAAVARPNEPTQKAAPARPKATSLKGRSGGIQKAAPARLRRGRGKERESADAEKSKTLIARAIDAYRDHGGSLELDGWKGTLIGQVSALLKNGRSERDILAACTELGRERAFPGYLKQRVEQLVADGGPCEWRGFDRSQLSPARLRECGCARCEEWATATAEAARGTL